MNKEKLKKGVVLIILGLYLSSCVTQSINNNVLVGPMLIQTKAQIKSNDTTNTVQIEIALLPKEAMRLEITALLGLAVATVVLTPIEIKYALHTTKQFGAGPFNEKTLYPLFKKNIDPRILWRIINNQPMSNMNLTCEMNSEAKPLKCMAQDGTQIKWTYQENMQKRIDIISDRFEMIWIFKDQSTMTGSHNEIFSLKKPNNYQEIIIK